MKKLKLNIQLFAATNVISCSQTSRDIENNKSIQKITTKFTRTSGTTYWLEAKTITFKCTYQNDDGTTTTLTKTTTFSFPSGSVGMTKSVSVEFEVPHKADGSQTISYSSSIATGTSMGTMTATGSSVLSTIPRASKVSCTSGNIEDTLAIIVEKYSEYFTSTVTYQIGTVTGTIATKSSSPSFALNTSSIADSIYKQIPNETSIKGTITCTTFNDDTQIGESATAEFTLSVNKDKNLANVSVSFVDTNTSIKSLTGSDTKFIKYFSKPKVTVTATGKNYATITGYKISMSGGSTYNTSEATFSEMLSNVITITVTDSRGFSNVIPCILDMVEYKKIICTGDVDRTEETSLEGILNAEIVFFEGSFGSVNNQLSLKAQYKKNGDSSWNDIGTINYTSNNGKITLSDYSLGELFDYNYEYIVRIVAEDSLMILSTDIPFQKGSSPLEIGDDLVNVNGNFTVNDESLDNRYIKQNGGTITGDLQVDGNLKAGKAFSTDPTNSFQTTLFGSYKDGYRLQTIRSEMSGISYFPNDSCGLAWTAGDTHGFLFARYQASAQKAWLGSGGGDKLNWVKEIAFKDDQSQLMAVYTGSTTISSTDHVKLTLTEKVKNCSLLSISDGVIKIGTGVTKVEVSGNVYFSTGMNSGDSIRSLIYKNDEVVARNFNRCGGTYEDRPISPFLVDVSEGDIIYLYGSNATAGRGIITENNYLVVKVIG